MIQLQNKYEYLKCLKCGKLYPVGRYGFSDEPESVSTEKEMALRLAEKICFNEYGCFLCSSGIGVISRFGVRK
jgi:hypothetical protein